MIYKNKQFKSVPVIFVDGDKTYNGVIPSAEVLTRHGYYPCITTAKPDGFYNDGWNFVDNQWVQHWTRYIPAPIVYEISKRKLRLALVSRGLGDALDALFNASPAFTQAWADSVTLLSNDPEFIEAMTAFKQIAGVTDEVITAVFREAAINV